MLTERSAATVRATLPAVGAAIGEITGQFYDRLFADRPELLRDLFNRGNQAAGTQRQALAGSIAAFAGHLLDHPDSRPDAMLARIAHKHASLGVTRDQYALVHRHLFAAIADVLGEAVTPQVAEAWDEVYWLMANALATTEERLTAEQDALAAGTWRPWEVVTRHDDTPDVAVLRLRPADGRPAAPFRAGQYVSVRVELPDGARQIRQYSLTGAFEGTSGPSPSSAFPAVRGRTARSPGTCTPAPAPVTCWTSPRPTATSSSTTPPAPTAARRRSCSPRPESAAPRSSPCSANWPRPPTRATSPSCTATAPRPRTRCAPSTPS